MDDHGVVILPIFWLLSELYSDCLHSLIEADLTFLTTKIFFINFIVKENPDSTLETHKQVL